MSADKPTPAPPLELVCCRECGAAVGVAEPKCWLCGGKLDVRVQTNPAKPPPDAQRSELSLLVALGVIALVLFGIAATDPESAVGLLVLTTPGILAVLVTALDRRTRGEPVTWLGLLSRFFMATLATIGILVAIALALIAALLVVCMSGGMAMDFR